MARVPGIVRDYESQGQICVVRMETGQSLMLDGKLRCLGCVVGHDSRLTTTMDTQHRWKKRNKMNKIQAAYDTCTKQIVRNTILALLVEIRQGFSIG